MSAAMVCLLVGGAVGGVTCSGETGEPPKALSEDEKAEAIAIALDDPRVGEALQDNEYEIGEVRLGEYGWAHKEESFSGVFPAVTFYIGNRELSGVDLVVYVDLGTKLVVHVSELYRRGPPPP